MSATAMPFSPTTTLSSLPNLLRCGRIATLSLPSPSAHGLKINVLLGLPKNWNRWVQVERIDMGGANRGGVQADAPELEALLESLYTSLGEVRTRIGPLVKEVGGIC
jgi:hypothetical protein